MQPKYTFADHQSETAFQAALTGKPIASHINIHGLTLITGTPLSGKTTAAKDLIQRIFQTDQVATTAYPASDERLIKILDSATDQQLPYLFFDNISRLMESPAMEAFLVAPRWNYRLLGRSNLTEKPIVTRIFAAGSHVALGMDLTNRTRIIELAPYDPTR